ncbi:hypothetical protein KP509_31G007100 [Ceratopteris richardii]|uniref:Uncharacterized protein n=1 Tax=Ceratopteris richardii TaxID=49495 RepID=A0A8T2QWM2_CERRI|nr:hypothetical protein KP509_31G007100 [Ceratopteris richardii]
MNLGNYFEGGPPVPKFSKELQTAIQDDLRRVQIDSAKKRAAAQNADYESFAALVSMAHLKPFAHKKSQQEESMQHTSIAMPSWSFDASGSLVTADGLDSKITKLSIEQMTRGILSTKRVDSIIDVKKVHSSSTNSGLPLKKTGHAILEKEEKSIPSTTNEGLALNGEGCVGSRELLHLGCSEVRGMTADSFKREWRKLGRNFEKKLTFLLAFSPDELLKIFKVELAPSILADIIEVIYWWAKPVAHESTDIPVDPALKADLEKRNSHQGTDEDVAVVATPQKSFDVHLALKILESLSACGRFSLALKLSGKQTVTLANRLFDTFFKSAEKMVKDNISTNGGNILCTMSGDKPDRKIDKVLETSKDNDIGSYKKKIPFQVKLKYVAGMYCTDF